MKFLISLLFCQSATAALVNVFHENRDKEASIYREILNRDYMIPEDLMSTKAVKNCENLKAEGKLDLCLKNNGDLLLVSVDRTFLDESLKVFRAP